MTKIHKILLWILAIVSIFGLGASGVKIMGGGYHNPSETVASTTTYAGILPIVQGGLATSTVPTAGQLLIGTAGGTYNLVASNTLPYMLNSASTTYLLTSTAASTYVPLSATATWNTAYTQSERWNGGATDLVAATGRTSLGLGDSAVLASSTWIKTEVDPIFESVSTSLAYVKTESDPVWLAASTSYAKLSSANIFTATTTLKDTIVTGTLFANLSSGDGEYVCFNTTTKQVVYNTTACSLLGAGSFGAAKTETIVKEVPIKQTNYGLFGLLGIIGLLGLIRRKK